MDFFFIDLFWWINSQSVLHTNVCLCSKAKPWYPRPGDNEGRRQRSDVILAVTHTFCSRVHASLSFSCRCVRLSMSHHDGLQRALKSRALKDGWSVKKWKEKKGEGRNGAFGIPMPNCVCTIHKVSLPCSCHEWWPFDILLLLFFWF